VPKILYKARDPAGHDVTGFVDAPTAAAAVAKLKAQGLVGVELHESPGIAAHHDDRPASDAREAAFLLRLRAKPGMATFLGEVARRSRVAIALDLALVVAGLALREPWLVAGAVAAQLLIFGVPIWRHRHARRFDRFLRAMAYGDWAGARRDFERLRRGPHPASVQVQMPFYDAQLRVREGEPLASVLARLATVRDTLAPDQFHSRSASVHSAAKDYEGFLACMRAAWEASPEDPSRQVDYALANARVGNLVLAQELLSRVDMDALEVHGRPFVLWARGLVDLRNDRPGAGDALAQAVDGLMKVASPAALGSLALCSGACAIAMQRAGDAAGAKAMVARVWPLLKVHADTRLRAEIEREVGTP